MDPFEDVRAHCLAIEGVTERLSHGAPTFFQRRGKSFVTCHDDHHGDGKLALWMAAPPGAQEAAIAADPEVYYRPAYVGSRGWLGVRLDRGLDPDVVRELLDEAHATVA